MRVFKFILLCLCFVVIGESCNKYENPNLQEVSSQNRSEDDFEDGNCTQFTLSQLESITTGRQAMAFAFSKAFYNNAAFRSFIFSALSPDHHRFKEIVVGNISELKVDGSAIRELLNKELVQLQAFYGDKDPFRTIIQSDVLLSIWLPNKFLNNLPMEDFFSQNPYLPIYLNETSQMFYNQSVCINFQDETVGFHMTSAVVHKLYDPASMKYVSIDVGFEGYHGFSISECNAVENAILSKPNYVEGFKLIDPIDDVQNVYSLNCGGITHEPHDSDMPLIPTVVADVECQRSSLEQKLIGNYTNNTNIIEGFRITNIAAMQHINAHPCNEWLDNEANGTRAFQFTWLASTSGITSPITKRKIVHCYKTDLMKPGVVHWTWRWSWRIWDYIPVVVSIDPPVLKYFPMPFQMDLFSSAPILNHWNPEVGRNGDAVQIDVKVVYFGNCTNASQSTNTNEFKFNLSLSDGLLKKGLNNLGLQVGTFEIKNSQTHQTTFTVQGDKIYDLGTCEFYYCDPYPFLDLSLPDGGSHGLKWYQFKSTGSVDLHLWSGWN